MYQATLTAGQTSQPQAAGIGSIAKLTISSGSGYVQYTFGSFADITNNVATWVTWPNGTVSATTQDTAGTPIIVRFVCVTGTVAVLLADPSESEFPANVLIPWESMQPSYSVGIFSNVLGLGGPNNANFPVLPPTANTIYTAGDSFSANGLIVTGSNFINRASEGVFNYCDGFLGGVFTLMGNVAVGGKTCRQMIDEQFPTIFALTTRPKYVWFTAGLNDIYADLQSATTTYLRIIEAVQKLIGAGITPIWSTIWCKAYDAVATPKAVQCNDMLRLYAASNNCGIFWDGASITNDPTDSNNQGRTPLASYYYDSLTHPNNMFAMRIGQYAAQQISSRIPQQNLFSVGNEDLTFSGAISNLLTNPSFIGSGAASGTGMAGVFPTNWKADWPTRGGTPTATGAIVSITDPATGLQIANGFELTVSGTANSGDILRIYQSDTENSGLRTNLTTGSVVQSECIVKVTSGANMSSLAHRIQANTNEATWFGSNGQTAVTLPATIPAIGMRTYPLTVLGSGTVSQARFDLRITFNGAGTGSAITIWRPRFRKVS